MPEELRRIRKTELEAEKTDSNTEGNTETEEEEDYFDDENTSIIRAKWIFDGAETLDDVIECLKHEIEHFKKLKEEGWELIQPVEDDYGFIKKKTN